ncbi:DUF4345 domain-containing protein [Rhodococcus sp. WS4]|nr:DUF4345 domain-containing protein [Rhodococcus sp. WS4]
MQWTLGIMALVPTISGVQQVLLGADAVPGNISEVSAVIDGELRYANVFKVAVGPIILSRLGTVEDSTAVTAALGTVFIGGLARLWSWRQTGRPHSIGIVAIALEVGFVPVILAWRRRFAIQGAGSR